MLVGVVNLVGMLLAVDTSLPVIGPSPVQNKESGEVYVLTIACEGEGGIQNAFAIRQQTACCMPLFTYSHAHIERMFKDS